MLCDRRSSVSLPLSRAYCSDSWRGCRCSVAILTRHIAIRKASVEAVVRLVKALKISGEIEVRPSEGDPTVRGEIAKRPRHGELEYRHPV